MNGRGWWGGAVLAVLSVTASYGQETAGFPSTPLTCVLTPDPELVRKHQVSGRTGYNQLCKETEAIQAQLGANMSNVVRRTDIDTAADLRTLLTGDYTGSGSACFAVRPTLTQPILASYTLGSRPSNNAGAPGANIYVTSTVDCTNAGSATCLCRDNGTGWDAVGCVGGGSGGGTIIGTVGTTDKSLVRANGTGGITAQGSPCTLGDAVDPTLSCSRHPTLGGTLRLTESLAAAGSGEYFELAVPGVGCSATRANVLTTTCGIPATAIENGAVDATEFAVLDGGITENEVTGTQPVTRGGTGFTLAPDDSVLVGNGATYDQLTLPACADPTTSKLLYDQATRQFSCGTDQNSGSGGAAPIANVVYPFGQASSQTVAGFADATCYCWEGNSAFSDPDGIYDTTFDVATPDENATLQLRTYSASGGTLEASTTGIGLANAVRVTGLNSQSRTTYAAAPHWVCLGLSTASAPSPLAITAAGGNFYCRTFSFSCASGSLPATITSIIPGNAFSSNCQPPAIAHRLQATGTTVTTTSSTSTSTTSTSTSSTTSTTASGATTSSTTSSTSTTSTTSSSTTSSTVSGQTVQVLLGAATAAQSATATRYIAPSGGNSWLASTSESLAETIISTPGTIGGLRIVLPTAPDNGAGTQSYQYTVRLNGATPATNMLRCTVSETATTCQDLNSAHNYAVVAGDRISLEGTPSGTPATSVAKWTVLYRPTTANQTLISGTGSFTGATSALLYGMPFGTSAQTGENVATLVAAAAGTLSNLYVRCGATADSGVTEQWTIRQNVATPGTPMRCTTSSSSGTCNDTSHTYTIALGDRLSFEYTPTAGTQTTAHQCSFGATFVPTTSDRFLVGVNVLNNTPLSSALPGTLFEGITGNSSAYSNATETSVQHLAQLMTFRTVAVSTDAGVGGSCTLTTTLRVNGADGDSGNGILSCAISSNGTACNASVSVAVAADDLINSHMVPSASGCTTSRSGRIGYAASFTGSFP